MSYGGDEVQALVLDIGADTTRAGYAGDDTPKVVFPTSYGYTVNNPSEGAPAEGGQPATTLYIGENGPSFWRPRMEVSNPFEGGIISDFEPIPAIVSHALNHSLRVDPSEHPILLTEPAWNTQGNRERLAEIMFEEFHVPAFYIANTGVLNAFAAGRHTALVVDIGKQTASVLPVVEGFVLRKGVAQSALPQLLHANALHMLTRPTSTRLEIDLTPRQLIYSKQPVDLHQPPQFELRDERIPHTTASWRTWAQGREVDEWIANAAGVLEHNWSEQLSAGKQPKAYEFPTGYRTVFGPDRFLPAEIYFNQSHLAAADSTLPSPLTQLVAQSLKNCEGDIRTPLVGSVVVTGGGSLLPGVLDRLSNELIRTVGTKAKVIASGNLVERRYGAWIGGSILASLGSFHQLWISAQEWQEHGRAIVGQRCK